MGADLILTYFCVPAKSDMNMLRGKIHKYLATRKMSEKDMYELMERGYYEDFDFGEEDTRLLFREIVNDLFNAIEERDVTWIDLKGKTMWITGGMSWGDTPTESYSVFEKFNSLPYDILEKGNISWS